MGDLEHDGRELSVRQQYEALLAVSEVIVGHRDLGALFQELAGRLQLVVRFDFLALVLLDAGSNTTRVHVLQTSGFWPEKWLGAFPLEETPNGNVLQTQEPLIVSEQSQLARWPRFQERMAPFGISSLCYLPLTTVRCRLGVLGLEYFALKIPLIVTQLLPFACLAGVLLGQSVVAVREKPFVQRFLEMNDPGRMKVVENPGINPRPIMHWHGDGSPERSQRIVRDEGT